jgi:hypothetical protein
VRGIPSPKPHYQTHIVLPVAITVSAIGTRRARFEKGITNVDITYLIQTLPPDTPAVIAVAAIALGVLWYIVKTGERMITRFADLATANQRVTDKLLESLTANVTAINRVTDGISEINRQEDKRHDAVLTEVKLGQTAIQKAQIDLAALASGHHQATLAEHKANGQKIAEILASIAGLKSELATLMQQFKSADSNTQAAIGRIEKSWDATLSRLESGLAVLQRQITTAPLPSEETPNATETSA